MTKKNTLWWLLLALGLAGAPLLAVGAVSAFAWRGLRGGFVMACDWIDRA